MGWGGRVLSATILTVSNHEMAALQGGGFFMTIKSLAELTSRRYKIFKDESWHHERSEVRTADWMWYEQLHCPNDLSFIGLYSLDPITYQFSTNRPMTAGKIWAVIKDKPGVQSDFQFDGEAILYFPPELVVLVADMAGARKKRHGREMSAEDMEKLIEAGKSSRFQPKFTGLQGA
jgi:hypothetical protein